MPPRIRTVQIKNYKSLASVSVDLEPFTVLVGPNGSGKSNFVDALAFVRDSLLFTAKWAVNKRGGFPLVAHDIDRVSLLKEAAERSEEELDEAWAEHGYRLGFRLVMTLSMDSEADYAFEISTDPLAGQRAWFRDIKERCVVRAGQTTHEFEIQSGRFTKEIPGIRPKLEPDRLALHSASSVEEFRAVYDFLSSMRTYNIEPEKIRQLQDPSPETCLGRTGNNAPSVLARLLDPGFQRDAYERVCGLMGALVPGVKGVRRQVLGMKETIVFKQDLGGGRETDFLPDNMSDGTLRILGILLAAYQQGYHPVVAIEEPEATVHPAAAETLMEILTDAADERQILITTHSPDLLDYKDLKDTQIRVVNWEDGQTYIAPLSNATRQTVQDRLYTPGELLSVDELNLNLENAKQASKEVDLFGEPFRVGSDGA